MKVAFLLVALVTMVTSRELKQLGIDFDICPPLVIRNCCRDFDFGKITQLHSGKAWPEETECEFVVSFEESVDIRKIDKPLKKKDDIHAYVDIEAEESSVNFVRTVTWDLFKYAPPNNIWTADGEFCLCPTPGVGPIDTTVPAVVVDEDEDEPATLPIVTTEPITTEAELVEESAEAIAATDDAIVNAASGP